MFLRAKTRFKDGKEHRYYSIVESRRVTSNRIVQRHVLYLGEINDSQKASWCKTIEVFQDGKKPKQLAIFPDDRQAPNMDCETVQVQLSGLQLSRPRQWGACWMACAVWDELRLDDYWQSCLPASREGTSWLNVLKTQVFYCLIDAGSEWRLHREWYSHSALSDLLGMDEALTDDTLYRCLDLLLKHKNGFFSFLKPRWQALFGAGFEVLLYDLTSTYFECDPPDSGKRRFGYSRDKRPDCVQVVIALIVTKEGFPLAYEVMNGNTSDKTTLPAFLEKIENQYGKANRIWVMDRGIPTEEILANMRGSNPPISYLVGTPRGRLSALEGEFLKQPWEKARESVSVKLLDQEGEVYILARSEPRAGKERAIRVRKFKKLWSRLCELKRQEITRDHLLMEIGAAKKEAGRVFSLVKITLPKSNETAPNDVFSFSVNREKLQAVRRREGSYLLRSNLKGEDPACLWKLYIQLTEIEQVFKELKHDLAIRPIYHKKDDRIEAHIFVAFVAYCLQVTLKQRLKPLAPGLTPRATLEKFASIQMVDVHLPTTDGRHIILSRYTQPEKDHQILLQQMKMSLPKQPPPKIYAAARQPNVQTCPPRLAKTG